MLCALWEHFFGSDAGVITVVCASGPASYAKPSSRAHRIPAREVCARLPSTVFRTPALDSARVKRSLKSHPNPARRFSSLATTGCCPGTGPVWSDCSTSMNTRETTSVCTHADISSYGLSRGKKKTDPEVLDTSACHRAFLLF